MSQLLLVLLLGPCLTVLQAADQIIDLAASSPNRPLAAPELGCSHEQHACRLLLLQQRYSPL
jgi:hypothetical protein